MTTVDIDLTPIVDELVTRIVTEVTERLAERLFGAPQPTVAPEPAPARIPTPEAPAPAITPPARKHRVEGDKHTCEICGREGTRRYVQTSTGWKCSPTATACAPQFKRPGTYMPPQPAPANPPCDIPTKEFPANVTPPSRPAGGPGITAHCQDCTRTWNLTGRPLRTAIELHELKQGHIVDIYDQAAV